jgi:hypothetical protein
MPNSPYSPATSRPPSTSTPAPGSNSGIIESRLRFMNELLDGLSGNIDILEARISAVLAPVTASAGVNSVSPAPSGSNVSSTLEYLNGRLILLQGRLANISDSVEL